MHEYDPPSSSDDLLLLVKRAIVFKDEKIFEFLEKRYPDKQKKEMRFYTPTNSDATETKFLSESVLEAVANEDFEYSIIELRVGACYVIPRGRPHFFETLPGVEHTCVSWMTRIDHAELAKYLAVERLAEEKR